VKIIGIVCRSSGEFKIQPLGKMVEFHQVLGIAVIYSNAKTYVL